MKSPFAKKRPAFLGKLLLPILVVVFFVFLPLLNSLWIDYQWFAEVGYLSVFFTNISARILVFAGMFALVFVSAFITLRQTIKSIPDTYQVDEDIIDITMKVRKPGNLFLALVSGLFAALFSFLFSAGLWKPFLLFRNQTAFGEADPVFANDIGYYFFTLPLLEQLVSLLIFFCLLILVLNVMVHIFYLRNTLKNPEVLVKKFGYFIVVLFLLLALNYRLESLKILYSTRGSFYGAGYTDLLVTLKLYYAKIATSLFAAGLVVWNLKKQQLKGIWIAPLLLVMLTFAGAILETGVQNFIVSPNELSREEPHIANSITYTRKAYGLDNVERRDFPALWNLSAEDIANSRPTIENIRINDFRPAMTLYNQLQSIRLYYQFTNVSIDRYQLNGQQRQVFLSAREMDHSRIPAQAQNWINLHLKFTHGYGVTGSLVNELTPQGLPKLILRDIPVRSDFPELELQRPEIYFGNLTNQYVITDTKEMEFNYPMEEQNAETVYAGKAGIPLNLVNKIAFSIDKRSPKILVSGALTPDSKILIHRNILERTKKIAPFLQFDNAPYLVINEGRLFWILDGYTTSNRYPYSQPVDSSLGRLNYLRNPVKAVVDAYEGTVEFYMIRPEEDPIISTYAAIYPGLFLPEEAMPEGLRSHLKYPVEMFDIQAGVFSMYHMQNPRVFFNREDAWSIATEKYHNQIIPVRPYYLNMPLPGDDRPEFVLVQPYTAFQKNNMVSWFAARNDGDNYGKLILYSFPKQRLIYGPMQIESRIDQDATISAQLTLWGQQGSSVLRGNLMVIPIKESLLYVEPLYLQSDNANALPEVKQVILAYGDDIVMSPTLEEGLQRIFGNAATPGSRPVASGSGEGGTGSENGTSSLDALIDRANTLFVNAQEKLRQGDWAGYGQAMEDLEKVLRRLAEEQK